MVVEERDFADCPLVLELGDRALLNGNHDRLVSADTNLCNTRELMQNTHKFNNSRPVIYADFRRHIFEEAARQTAVVPRLTASMA